MSPVHLRNLGFQRNQLEGREGLSRTRRHGRGHLGHSGGWQDTVENNNHYSIHFPVQQEPQTRGLERYGSSSSAPQTPQIFISIEHGQQEFQPGIPLGRTWSKFLEDLFQRDRLQRPYGNHQRLESQQEAHNPGGSFQEKTRIKGQNQYHLQPEEERFRLNDPESVGFGERSAQEPEVVVKNSRISSPIFRNITPTQIEDNVVTPESNLNSDALWLQMSQFAEKAQNQFAELQESHERMRKLTASIDRIVKILQEGHAQLSKASEETRKGLNIIFEEQHHIKRERDCLDQEIKKLFDVYHNMKPQPQGHVMDNSYHRDDIKPYAMLINKTISPSQYQDGDNMSYSEKEALKCPPEASS
ncbi:hypothetical protein O181_053302 [Austropuccinia psidii MF-1]|uniref:Uncharacterized protein n=1 Tax=Austropuccinia psidii MF-1 TaxID=1389203 RepID=A0A9Q3E9E0_9BASI|nr:hypothetical protein [Austropuccinia psidii MF-1]